MSASRALILVCSVLALSACGSTRSGQPADSGQDATLPSPPIEAIDEPAPTAWPVDPSDAVATGTWTLCFPKRADGSCKEAQENKKLLQRIVGKKRPSGPLTSSEARAIAQLRLRGENARLRLIAWKSTSGQLCLAYEETDGERGNGAGPFGPCVPQERCVAICLSFPGPGSGQTLGVVSTKGDALRVTFDGGRVATYKLGGPLVRSFREYRVFMLDPGRDIPTRFELLAGGTVLAQKKRSVAELRAMCPDRPIAPGADECLQRPEAK